MEKLFAIAIAFLLQFSITLSDDSYLQTDLSENEEVIVTGEIESSHWESLGYCRITEYCPGCNSGYGHGSASGVYLENGHVACSWLPMGTRISIDGIEYTVVDVCGTDAIDIFRDTDYCYCDLNEYKEVYIWKE